LLLQTIYKVLRLTQFTGAIAHHEVYEDLGIHNNSVLDPSFNISNFSCLDTPDVDPGLNSAYECALTGKVRSLATVSQPASSRQSSQSIPGFSGSVSVSPKSVTSQGQATTSGRQSADWPIEQISPMVSLHAQCTAAGESVYECAKVGLRSFSPLDQQACPVDNDFSLSGNKDGSTVHETDNFQFPSWDQLPADFQNPTTSADFDSTIPISTTGFSMPNIPSTAADTLAWDNEEMDFAMDMDIDMDLGFDAFTGL
jgi:hypothetical protein